MVFNTGTLVTPVLSVRCSKQIWSVTGFAVLRLILTQKIAVMLYISPKYSLICEMTGVYIQMSFSANG